MIHLESNFVQFKDELLPKEGNRALLTFPFLHIYWTECCVSTAASRPGARARARSCQDGGRLPGGPFGELSALVLFSFLRSPNKPVAA